MTDYKCAPLDSLRFPLIKRLYKTHYPAGTPKKDDLIWSIEKGTTLCGAVKFRQEEENQLLSGLLVIPSLRGLGLGQLLLKQSKRQSQIKPCYCFAYAYLVPFYQKAGFTLLEASLLPPVLKSKFHRYCASGKDLVPLMLTR